MLGKCIGKTVLRQDTAGKNKYSLRFWYFLAFWLFFLFFWWKENIQNTLLGVCFVTFYQFVFSNTEHVFKGCFSFNQILLHWAINLSFSSFTYTYNHNFIHIYSEVFYRWIFLYVICLITHITFNSTKKYCFFFLLLQYFLNYRVINRKNP